MTDAETHNCGCSFLFGEPIQWLACERHQAMFDEALAMEAEYGTAMALLHVGADDDLLNGWLSFGKDEPDA